MLDESAKRRRGFTEGPTITLADGQSWRLADPESLIGDPSFESSRIGLREAESAAEALRAQYALCLDLLTRNYDLGPVELQTLFRFPAKSAALAEFQSAMREVALRLL